MISMQWWSAEPCNSKSKDLHLKDAAEVSTLNLKLRETRNLVPWTNDQKEVTLNYFKEHIKNKKPPKKVECENLKTLYGEVLNNKDWLKIKVFIQNEYSKANK